MAFDSCRFLKISKLKTNEKTAIFGVMLILLRLISNSGSEILYCQGIYQGQD